MLAFEAPFQQKPFDSAISSEISVVASLDHVDIPEVGKVHLVGFCEYNKPFPEEPLRKAMNVSDEGIAFVKNLLVADPVPRLPATAALQLLSNGSLSFIIRVPISEQISPGGLAAPEFRYLDGLDAPDAPVVLKKMFSCLGLEISLAATGQLILEYQAGLLVNLRSYFSLACTLCFQSKLRQKGIH